MKFYRKPKENNPKGKSYVVYMELDYGKSHYVCDITDESGDEATAMNELGLTLRARLTRSKGVYAMLEGCVFDPKRLLKSVCGITDYTAEPKIGGIYKDGYTMLTIFADGCVNKYMIFSESTLKSLVSSIKERMEKQV